MTWDLAGTSVHQFDAPIEIDLTDATGGSGIPVTAEPSQSWHADPGARLPGTSLPPAWQDGYWRAGGVVHILTRHLSLFAILTGTPAATPIPNAPPTGFSAASSRATG